MLDQRQLGWATLWTVCLACTLAAAGDAWGQEPQPPTSAPAASAPAASEEGSGAGQDGAAARPVSRGRLPNYFSTVVTPKQREEIYQLQAEYAEKIAALEAEIESLMAERDMAVDGVLEPEQLATVTKKREEAKKRREARYSRSAPADDESP